MTVNKYLQISQERIYRYVHMEKGSNKDYIIADVLLPFSTRQSI